MPQHRLLLVDDEQGILDALARLLFEEDYEIESATNGKDALKKMSSSNYSLIISDQRMPEMSGAEFLEKAKELSPDTIRIMLTGYSDMKDAIDAINKGGIYRYITKPWNDEELKLIVRQALRHYDLVVENRELHTLIKEQNQTLKDINKSLEQKVQERTRQIEAKNKELENNFITSIRVFSGLLSHYDEYLGQHSKRVAVLSRRLAQNLRLKNERVLEVEIAGLLHDLGTISLPKRILYADCRTLSKTERIQLERHPILGQEILLPIEKLRRVGTIIRHHHEHYDGTGYPDGLRGEEIPLESRIIALVDAYDCRANGRGYYQESSPQQALEEIKKNRGVSFDPEIALAFLDMIEGIKVSGAEEVGLVLSDLKKDMKLSRNVVTRSGVLLIEKDTVLQQKDLERIHKFHVMDPIVDKIYVYKRYTAPSSPPEHLS